MQAPTFAPRTTPRPATACRGRSNPVQPSDSIWPPAMQQQAHRHGHHQGLPLRPWLLGAALRLVVMAAAFTAALAWWPA